jgi:hypothetical protein
MGEPASMNMPGDFFNLPATGSKVKFLKVGDWR